MKQKQKIHHASFGLRAKAQIIDTFMIYMPLLYVIAYVLIGDAKTFRESFWGPLLGVVIYGLIVAAFLHFGAQTPGKRAYQIQVIRDDKKKIGFCFGLIRFFLFLVAGMSVIGLLMPLWRKDKKALHDRILKTSVIKQELIET